MDFRSVATIRHVLFAAFLVILPGFSGLTPAHASTTSGWEISYDTTDLTVPASPLPIGNTVLLNLAGIGPMLGVIAVPDSKGFTIETTDGRRWRWETGDPSLSDGAMVIPLAVPAMQEGPTLYLDPRAISELSGAPVSVDASSKKIVFQRRQAAVSAQLAEAGLPDGWQSFTIAKPKTVGQGRQLMPATRATVANLPPSYDRLNVSAGLGYVQGADLGLELRGSGRLAGGSLNMLALVTNGELGTRLRNSHLMWLDKEGGRGIEAGDMYSETWGLVQGARYTWKAGRDRWPSVGVNLNTRHTENPAPFVSYADEFRLGNSLAIRGEIGTDWSRFASVRYGQSPLQVFAFERWLPRDLGMSQGVYGSLSLSKYVSLFYGITTSTDEMKRTRTYRNAGVRIPILRRCGLVLGQTEYEGDTMSSITRSAGITVPLTSRVHLYLRYQKNDLRLGTIAGSLLNIRSENDSLLTSLSLFASPRVHLDYQRSMLAQDGRTIYREQLVTNYALSPRTSVQAISGFPNIADTDILRLRVEHRLKDDLSLLVDYGRLSPFQSTSDVFGKRGFMVMMRKTWPLWVPAKGGTVEGTVFDQLGEPVRNVAVRMGKYTAVSDKDGRYTFASTPSGSYRVGVAEETVPADYKVETAVRDVAVARDSEERVDFRLVPLGSILGRVYADKNGNGAYDDGEGVSEVPILANDRATSTDKLGRFGFYNLDPGSYSIRIGTEYMDKRYVVVGPDRVEAVLQPKGSITNLEFRLDLRKKPIIFAAVE